MDHITDTLDRVLLSQDAYNNWHALCASTVAAWKNGDIDPQSDIGTEMARAQPDGSLRIWCEVRGLPDLELLVPSGHWSWVDGMHAH